MADQIANSFRNMCAGEKKSVDQAVNDLMVEYKRKNLYDESLHQTLKNHLYLRNFKTEFERKVLVKFLKVLQKALV